MDSEEQIMFNEAKFFNAHPHLIEMSSTLKGKNTIVHQSRNYPWVSSLNSGDFHMDSQDTSSVDQTEETEPNKYKQSGNVNNEVLVNFSHLVATLNDESESKDFRPLIEFFQKDYESQLVQTWSFYAQVNNHPKLTEATVVLTRALSVLGSDKSVLEYGGLLIKTILNNYTRVLYRGLNNIRASLTIPTIKLMKEMVKFNLGQYVEDFISSFDFSLHSLPKILTVSRNDITSFNAKNKHHRLYIRFEFIEFCLQLIYFCPPLLRKDFISQNFKIMSAWFKQMDKADTAELMEQTLDVLSEKILKEKAFKKMTKTRILNELVLSKVYSFFYSPNKTLVKKVNQFFLTYGADPENSVAFPNNFLWCQDSSINTTNRGVAITVNQKQFRIHNKLLFNVLKNFKPWESDMQASTLLKILDYVPELIPPYCHLLASHGSHDPKMTSYWFGCTMILGRIIELKIPERIEKAQTDALPCLSLVMQAIFPAPLNKVSLTKSLQHEKLIIKQLTCQLLIFSFQKLEKVLRLYDKKGWNSGSASLRSLFYQNLPDLAIITSVTNQSYVIANTNKIIQLSLTLLLRYYSAIFPNFFSISMPSSNVYVDIMRKEKFSGMDLAIVDNFLQFQELNGAQAKWWNASMREYSLFTSLLKMASSKNSMGAISEKIHQLLQSMFHGTVAFHKMLCSPQRALIHSLQVLSLEDCNSGEITKIWKLLDETISRCMKTPYRYVDLSTKYERISPFLVVLAEQWKFVDKRSSFEATAKWICIFLRTMAISGESTAGVRKLAQETLADIPKDYTEMYLSFDNYESKAVKLFSDDSYFLSRFQEVSFFQHITIMPYANINKVTRYPLNKLDATGIIWRLQKLVADDEIDFNNLFKNAIDVLLAKLANFLTSNPTFDIMNPQFVLSIFPDDISVNNQKSFFASQALISFYQELGLEDVEFEKFAFHWLREHMSFLENGDPNSTKFVSTICNVLNPSDTLKVLQIYRAVQIPVLEIVLWKILREQKVSVPYGIFKHLAKRSFTRLDELLSQFIDQNRIEGFEPAHFIPYALEHSEASFRAFVRSNWFTLDLFLPYLLKTKGTKNALTVALTICDSGVTQYREFLQEVLEHCYQKLTVQEFSRESLELFCTYSEMLSEKQKMNILKYITFEYQEKYSALVVKFVTIVGNFDMPNVIAWLNKSILYGTKYFSDKIKVPNDDFLKFLEELENLTKLVNVWSKVNHSYLQAHIEVILNGPWITNSKILQYVVHLLLKGKRSEVQCGKMMQCLLNNERNTLSLKKSDDYLRFTTAAVIFILFMIDPQQNGNVLVQSKLLDFYAATISCEDRIILKILEDIETKTTASWTNQLYFLDFLEGEENNMMEVTGNIKIITHEREGLFVTLDKNVISNTVSNYILGKPAIPTQVTWEALLTFYRKNEKLLLGANGTVYDPTFLILLSVQSGANLVTHSVLSDGSTKYTFQLQRFLSCGILQVLLITLADEGTPRNIALRVLSGILNSLDENSQFKYGDIIGILLKKIIYTFEKAEVEGKPINIAPCVWFSIARICELLINPGIALHEKAYRWVLSSPFIMPNDFPLLQDLSSPHERNKDHEDYYRELAWVLECMELGIKTTHDVEFFKNRNVFEWLFNMTNLPYLNARMCAMINSIFYKIQRLEGGGSTLLTRFASVSNLEAQRLSLGRRIENMSNVLTNQKNDKNLKNRLVLQTHQLNIDELLKSQTEIIKSEKRLRKWTEDDQENIEKRIRM